MQKNEYDDVTTVQYLFVKDRSRLGEFLRCPNKLRLGRTFEALL
jgi:hypothetical protein